MKLLYLWFRKKLNLMINKKNNQRIIKNKITKIYIK